MKLIAILLATNLLFPDPTLAEEDLTPKYGSVFGGSVSIHNNDNIYNMQELLTLNSGVNYGQAETTLYGGLRFNLGNNWSVWGKAQESAYSAITGAQDFISNPNIFTNLRVTFGFTYGF